MKKDEAISILATSLRPREPKDRARYDEAVKMAINALNCSEIPNNSDTISRQAALNLFPDDNLYWDTNEGYFAPHYARTLLRNLPSVQPERKAVFNRDIAIEAICDEVMLWFDISATKAYEIAETAVKRIEVRMEKTNRGEKDERFNQQTAGDRCDPSNADIQTICR